MKYSTTQIFLYTISLQTRMHSSRMRTARLLPVSPSMHCSRGSCTWSGGVPGPGGYLVRGVCLFWGCTWSQEGVPGLRVYLVQGYLGRGVPGPSGVYLVWGVYLVGGVYLVRGCTWSGGCTYPGTPPCGQNDRHV